MSLQGERPLLQTACPPLKLASSVRVAGLSAILRQLVQFGSIVVLSRYLTPHDFGLVSLAIVFAAILQVIGEFGIEAALIQRAEPTTVELNLAFWVGTLAGLGFCALLLVAAGPIGAVLDESDLKPLLVLSAICIPIIGLSSVPRAMLVRQERFVVIGVADILGLLIGGAAAVGLARAGHGAVSAVWQTVIWAAFALFTVAIAARWRPGFAVRGASRRQLLGFSLNMVGFNFANHWARNADNLVVGRVFGAGQLGIYSRAYQIVLFPTSQVSLAFGRVLLNALSRAGESDPRDAGELYCRATRLVTTLTFPLMSMVAVLARPLVLVLFGPEWVGVIPILRVLALVGAVQSVGVNVGYLYQALGATTLMFRWGVVASALYLLSFGVGAALGSPIWVAVSYAGVVAILAWPLLAVPLKLAEMRPVDVLRRLGMPAVLGLAAGVTGLGIVSWMRHEPALSQLSAGGVCSAAVSIAIVLTFDEVAGPPSRALLRKLASGGNVLDSQYEKTLDAT